MAQLRLHPDVFPRGIAYSTNKKGVAEVRFDRDELATITFALMDYASSLDKSLLAAQEKRGENYHEEVTVLHDVLSKVHRILYDLYEDHDKNTKVEITTWLDI